MISRTKSTGLTAIPPKIAASTRMMMSSSTSPVAQVCHSIPVWTTYVPGVSLARSRQVLLRCEESQPGAGLGADRECRPAPRLVVVRFRASRGARGAVFASHDA
jgi:hypothetical protein